MTDAPNRIKVPEERSSGEWRTALALVVMILGVSVTGPGVLAGVPLMALVLVLPVLRKGALLVAAVVAVWVFGLGVTDPLWYFERGWAVLMSGWFVALTTRWPKAPLTSRSLGAVAGAGVVAAGIFGVSPGMWSAIDWRVRERLAEGVNTALDIFGSLQGGEGLPANLEASVLRTAEVQADLFPAFLGLASMAGLAVAWWLYRRMAAGEPGALGRLREFRFNDQLVWLFIGGLLTLLVGLGEGWSRAGSNTVVFMGGLYALRGAAVVLFLNGGISLLGAIVLGVGMLFVAPILLAGALFVGLSDTWLDVRNRVRTPAS